MGIFPERVGVGTLASSRVRTQCCRQVIEPNLSLPLDTSFENL